MNNILKKNVLLVSLVTILLFFLFFFYLSRTTPLHSDTLAAVTTKDSANLASLVTPPPADKSLPLKLLIPAIKVDAKIEHLGMTPQGAMDAPKGRLEVAWYNLGPKPGEVGSAVIAGHKGWKNNLSAVFDNLGKLKKGDKIYVTDGNGKTLVFVVTRTKIFDAKADSREVFVSKSGRHLNLITCVGEWDTVTRTSSQRLVVFTDLVSN